jgi:hypothetical protein
MKGKMVDLVDTVQGFKRPTVADDDKQKLRWKWAPPGQGKV